MSTPEISASAIAEHYQESTPKSKALYERAMRSLPGGNTRTTLYMQPYPFYFERGNGCRVYDADGNERLDFINNYTSLILGHAHPKVVAAVRRQLGSGMSIAAPTELEIALAEAIKQRLPSIDLLRFTNSGTEATMMALRVARAYTGRDKIAKFEASYHGGHDYAATDPSAAQNPGIPAAVTETIIMLSLNDQAAVERIVTAHRSELAAIIIEPVLGAGGAIVPQPGFLQFLREITERYGIVLIFDEVISFRIGYHGAQGAFGVQPDLTTLGKIIGGGLPVGMVGGREAIMAWFDPRRPNCIGHGGTFNANPMTMAAGLATLEELTAETFERLNELGGQLKMKLCALFSELGVAAQINQIASLFAIHFSDTPVTDLASLARSDRQKAGLLSLAVLNHGVMMATRGMGCLSTPMTEAEIDAFIAAIRLAIHDMEASFTDR